jgi:hypothetical protein
MIPIGNHGKRPSLNNNVIASIVLEIENSPFTLARTGKIAQLRVPLKNGLSRIKAKARKRRKNPNWTSVRIGQ